jgi:hypothetical protein
MTQDELEKAILERWESGWDALHPPAPDPDFIPVAYGNESFDGVPVWVHVAIEPTVRVRTTQGRAFGRYLAKGIIRVRLFGSVDVGSSQLAQLVDEIIGTEDAAGVLDEANINGLIYREGNPRPGPSEPGWEMRVITVPYEMRS